MDFFGIGPLEILLIFILALILLGPGKITEVARTLGKVVRTIRNPGPYFTPGFTN
jgi:Sec-independent protein translocase protein TatA